MPSSDLDRLKELNETLANITPYTAFMEALHMAVVISDKVGVVVAMNRQAELLFGYPRSELIGQPVEKLMPERLREGHVSHRSKYMDEPRPRGMGTELNLSILTKDQREIPAEITLGPLVEPGGTFIVVCIRRKA